MDRKSGNAPLVLRSFERLGRKDREAVLAQLSEAERQALEEAMQSERRARAEEEARSRASDRQYLAYSAWLAGLIEASAKHEDCGLTAATREALVAEHQAAHASRQDAPEPVMQSIMRRVLGLLYPEARAGQ